MKNRRHLWTLIGVFSALTLGCSSSESPKDGGSGVVVGGGTGGVAGSGGAAGGLGGGGASGSGGGAGAGGSGGATTPLFDGPQTLSASGLYGDFGARTLAPGVLEYGIQKGVWTDGAVSRRFILLPTGESIDTTLPGRWHFPTGTTTWKEFIRDGVLVETRMIRKRGDGDWQAIAYLWRDDESDADAVVLGAKNGRGTAHEVPSEVQCPECHEGERDYLLSVSAVQLDQPSIELFQSEGVLTDLTLAEFVAPGNAVESAALELLHANCGHCHSNQYFLADKFYLRLDLRPDDSTLQQTQAYSAINAPTAHIVEGTTFAVVPGDPSASQAYVRYANRDIGSMPPLGTLEVDDGGLTVLRTWIESLPSP